MSQSSPALSNNPPTIDLYAALAPDALAAFLAERFERHTRRAAELNAAYKRFLLATSAGIPDDVVLAKAVDFKEQIRVAIADCEKTRVAVKAPVWAAVQQIDGLGRELNEPLSDARVQIEARCTSYMVEKDRAAREAARIEAERAADEAARLIEQANEAPADTAPEDVAEIEAAAEAAAVKAEAAAAVVEAKPAELTRVRTSFGSTAALRENWVLVGISDIKQVPWHLLMLNKQATDLAIRQGMHECPGLVIENRPKMR